MTTLVKCHVWAEYKRIAAISAESGLIPFLGRSGDDGAISAVISDYPWICPSVLDAANTAGTRCPDGNHLFPLDFDVWAGSAEAETFAELLGGWTSGQYRRFDPDRNIELETATTPVAIVIPPGQQALAAAWRLLDLARRVHGRPESVIPRVTLVTARDELAMSWLIAKIIAASLRPAGRTTRFHVLTPDANSSNWTKLERHSDGGFTLARARESGASASLRASESCDVLLATTHGFDACADGGDGFVICGLHPNRAPELQDGAGILACGHGYECPRGPHPLALRHFRAQVLMLSSCNGMRPGAGLLKADYNLGLSFIDGSGVSYCSTPYSSSGGALAVAAFGAAMASSYGFAAAINRANTALLSSGLEDASLVGVGNPSDRRSLHHGTETPPQYETDSFPASIERDSATWLIVIETRAPHLIALAERGALRWSILPANVEEADIFWDQRVVRDGAQEALVVHVYRFPDPISRCVIAPVVLDDVMQDVNSTLEALSSWKQLWRRLGSNDPLSAEGMASLGGTVDELSEILVAKLGQLRFNGRAARDITDLLETADAVARHSRDLVMTDLLPQLASPNWLTNVNSSQYLAYSFEKGTCPYCKSPGVIKHVRHALTHQERIVLVCALCGIVSDRPVKGCIADFRVDSRQEVAAGDVFEVRLEVDGRFRADRSLILAPRLSVIGQANLIPSPAQAEWRSGSHNFLFRIPVSLVPHRYFVKALAASEHEIAFAARPFFVVSRSSSQTRT